MEPNEEVVKVIVDAIIKDVEKYEKGREMKISVLVIGYNNGPVDDSFPLQEVYKRVAKALLLGDLVELIDPIKFTPLGELIWVRQ